MVKYILFVLALSSCSTEQWRNLANANQGSSVPQQQPVQQAPMQQAKQTDYNCMNSCQAKGNQYGLCQSRCSY